MSFIDTSLFGLTEAEQVLDRLSPAAQTALRQSVARKTIDLRNGVKGAIAEIFHSTGPLYQSVQAEMEASPGQVTGRVFTQDVPYAAAQEYGGTWQIPEIFPMNAQALAFMAPAKLGFSSGNITSEMVFARHTKAHPVTLPARSYARSTLFRMRDEIVQDVRTATVEAT